MARIPPLARLQLEDFPKQTEWIGRLLEPLNSFFERVTSALNKSLTITDNFLGAIKTVELNGTWPVKVAWELPQRPVTVLVGQIVRSDNTAFTLTDAVQVQWTFNQNGQLQINGVTGVTPSSGTKYTVTLECKAG